MKDLYDGKDDPEEKKFLEYLKVSLDTVTFHTRKEKELDIGINVPEYERNAHWRVEVGVGDLKLHICVKIGFSDSERKLQS